MFEALRGLRVCKIFAEHAGLWLFSLQDLAVVICSESKSPGDAVAIVHKALCVYHTREGPPYFQETFCGEVLDAFIFSKSTYERRARHVGIVLRWRLGLGYSTLIRERLSHFATRIFCTIHNSEHTQL